MHWCLGTGIVAGNSRNTHTLLHHSRSASERCHSCIIDVQGVLGKLIWPKTKQLGNRYNNCTLYPYLIFDYLVSGSLICVKIHFSELYTFVCNIEKLGTIKVSM